MLEDKKILFIAPIFHDYHLLIKDKLTEMGAYVDFYAERNYGVVFKVINNFFNEYLKTYQKAHYAKIITQVSHQKYDYLFVIRGYMLSDEFIDDFRKMNPGAKLIMYQWDSNRTNPFAGLLNKFDDAYSFDFEDCKKMSSLKYVPLFYSDDVGAIKKDKKDLAYDFFFMGWFLPERYNAIVKFKDLATEKGYRLKAFLFLPFTSYIKEYFRGNKLDRNIVSLKAMSRSEYLRILGETNIMVDVSSPNQTGLAMRIIEALGCATKILTNNYRIREDASAYDKDYIAFFDANSPSVETSFLESKIAHKPNGVLSIEEWIKKIFFYS
jgi:hypothetical protein